MILTLCGSLVTGRRRQQAVAAILLVTAGLMLSGCSAWHQKRPPAKFVMERKPERVRVVTVQGHKLELRSPTVAAADSLIGRLQATASPADTMAAIALRDIQKLEAREGDALKTAGLVLGIVVLSLTAFGALVALTWE